MRMSSSSLTLVFSVVCTHLTIEECRFKEFKGSVHSNNIIPCFVIYPLCELACLIRYDFEIFITTPIWGNDNLFLMLRAVKWHLKGHSPDFTHEV